MLGNIGQDRRALAQCMHGDNRRNQTLFEAPKRGVDYDHDSVLRTQDSVKSQPVVQASRTVRLHCSQSGPAQAPPSGARAGRFGAI